MITTRRLILCLLVLAAIPSLPIFADAGSPFYEIELPKEGIDTGKKPKTMPPTDEYEDEQNPHLSKAAIKKIQSQLKALGFKEVSPSGLLDRPTREAIRDLQEQYDLVVTGTLNAQTRDLIERSVPIPKPTETKPGE